MSAQAPLVLHIPHAIGSLVCFASVSAVPALFGGPATAWITPSLAFSSLLLSAFYYGRYLCH